MTNHLRRSLITTIPLAVIGFVVRIPGTARAFPPPPTEGCGSCPAGGSRVATASSNYRLTQVGAL